MNNIIMCNREDIKYELLSIYQEMKAEAKAEAETKAKEMLLTADEVLSTLKISNTTLWRWQKENYLTPIYVGGKKRYKRSDIMAIIEKGDVKC